MASILKVDELQGIATTGDITVTSEGGAATQSLQQGLAKVWAYFNGQAATPVYFDSFNCSTLIDSGTGTYNPQLTNPMSNANFSAPATGHASGASWCFAIYTGGKTTHQLHFQSVNTTPAAVDSNPCEIAAFGDLA